MPDKLKNAISELSNNTYYTRFDQEVKEILREAKFIIQFNSTIGKKLDLLATNIEFPTFNTITNKVYVQGRFVEKPVLKDIQDKTLSITMYQDESGALFQYLVNKINAVDKFNAYSGAVGNNYESITIVQNDFDGGTPVYQMNFNNIYIKSITPSNNNTSSENLSQIRVSLGFTDVNVFAQNGIYSFGELVQSGSFLGSNGMGNTLNGFLDINVENIFSGLVDNFQNGLGDVLDNFIDNIGNNFASEVFSSFGGLNSSNRNISSSNILGNSLSSIFDGIF